MSHRNARLTVHGRRILVERVLAGRPDAHVLAEARRPSPEHRFAQRPISPSCCSAMERIKGVAEIGKYSRPRTGFTHSSARVRRMKFSRFGAKSPGRSGTTRTCVRNPAAE
ncbi:hypothetical protein F0344_07280 [Streptomyces finlayi]|uniref:Uncharacterized protein n=1 Tax=Streptomyces finlayi TaxID=67296 RepID=A0A7G7BGH1_9ACTN|nr:hypothetical protein F0344_07280 [Streptomyces finlayi]